MENLKPPEDTSPPPLRKKNQSPHLTKSLAHPPPK